MLNFKCSAPSSRQKREETTYERSSVRRGVNWFRNTFGVSSNVDLRKAAELDDIDAREIYSRHLAEMGAINPEEFNRMSSWVAAKFNQVNKAMGIDPNNLSAEGQARLNFLDIKRNASGIVNNVVRFHQVQTLKRITNSFGEVLGRYGVKGQRVNELFNEFVEYGHIPEKTIHYGSDISRQFNTLRYENWKANLMSDLSINEADFNALSSQAFEYASVTRAVRDAARNLGVDVGDLEGIGYFTRIGTDDFMMRFGEMESDPNLYDDLLAGHKLFASVFNKTRTTQHYAPNAAIDTIAAFINSFKHRDKIAEIKSRYRTFKDGEASDIDKTTKEARKSFDEVQRAKREKLKAERKEALKAHRERIKEVKKNGETLSPESLKFDETPFTFVKEEFDATSFVAAKDEAFKRYSEREAKEIRSIGIQPEQIRDLIDDPIRWRDFLDNEVPDKVLDTMVESGMLQQIPMTSKEVFEMFAKKYKLPYKGLDEMFILDPELALTEYSKSLGKAAGNSRVFSYVSTRGVEEGWAIGKDAYKEMVRDKSFPFGSTEQDWVKLGDMDWRKIGIEPQTIKNRESVYLHRNVAEQLQAVMYISGSPAALSNFASGIQRFSSLFRMTVLAKEGYRYANRVMFGSVVQTLRATGLNPASIPIFFKGMVDVTRAMTNGIEFLDDTVPRIKVGDQMYTMRRAFEELATYRFAEFAPLTAGDTIKAMSNKKDWARRVFQLYSPRTVQMALHYAATAAKPGDGAIRFSKRLGQYYVNATRDSLEAWMAPFATFANVSDVAARWTILQLKGGSFDSWQDVMRFTDDYIPSPDASGTFTKSFGAFVQPFSGYAMWNPPATIRHMLREPQKFVAYHKLLSVMSRNASRPCSTAPEGGYQQWMLDAYPVTIGCDGDGNPLVMNINTFDPHADALVYFRETGESIIGMSGGFSGTSQEQRQQLLRDGLSQFFRSQLDKSYWRGALEFVMNEDIETGREFQDDVVTWNGIEMSPRVRSLLQSVPIPGLPAPLITPDELNRRNPFGVFGYSEMKDAWGNVVRPEKLSIFNTRRSDRDTRYDDAIAMNEVTKLMREMGLSMHVARVAENMQFSQGNIERDLADLKKLISTQQNDYLENVNKYPEGEKKKRYEFIRQLAKQAALVELDLIRVKQWMNANNIPQREVFTKYKELVRQSNGEALVNGGLPLPSAKGLSETLNDYYETLKKMEDK